MAAGNGNPTRIIVKAPSPPQGGGSASGGRFTPSGFVPSPRKVTLPTDQAPYKHGKSPTQVRVKALGGSGEVKVVDHGPSTSDVQRGAQTMATQRMLNSHGFAVSVDGQWGPQTQRAYDAYLRAQAKQATVDQGFDASRNPLYRDAPSPQSVLAQLTAQREAAAAQHESVSVPQTKFSSVKRYEQHYAGEPVAGSEMQMYDYAKHQWVAPGSAVSPTVQMRERTYYTDANTHAQTRGAVSAAQQEAQFTGTFGAQTEQDIANANRVASPGTQAVLGTAARILPGVGLATSIRDHNVSAGGIAGEVANDLAWLGPAELMAPFKVGAVAVKALLAGGDAADAAAAAKEAVTVMRAQSLARFENPIIRRELVSSSERQQFVDALKQQDIPVAQQHALIQVTDHNAITRAAQTGEKPSEAWKAANFGETVSHDVTPTVPEARALTNSGLPQRNDLTDFPLPYPHDEWANPDLLKARMSTEFHGLPFYSKLHMLVADMPPKVGIPEMLGKIKSAGIKEDEVKWNRFDTFLASAAGKGQKSITREEALGWLDENYLKLEENVRGDSVGATGDYNAAGDVNSNEPKFATYTIEGGKDANYKEFTIRLPEDPYGGLYQYTGHFPDANIVAHARTTDRMIGDDHSLMIEEIQSDWHQAGQKQGYKVPVTEHPDYERRMMAVDQASADVDSIAAQLKTEIANLLHTSPEISPTIQMPEHLKQAWTDGILNYLGANETDRNSVRDLYDRMRVLAEAPAGSRIEVRSAESKYGSQSSFETVLIRPGDNPAETATFAEDRPRRLDVFHQYAHDDPAFAHQQAMATAKRDNMILAFRPADRQSILSKLEALYHALGEQTQARSVMRALESDASRGVAHGPFAKTWHELAFKRMLAEAVDKGYARLAWTTGRTQAERYDLGNFFKHINVEGGSSYGDYSDATQQWAREMAQDSVDGMSAEELGVDEEQILSEASDYFPMPDEEQFTDAQGNFDQEAYDQAVEERDQEVQDRYDSNVEWYAREAYQSSVESETQYYLDNAHEYGHNNGNLVVNAQKHDGSWTAYDASTDSGEDNYLANVIGPDLADKYFSNGETSWDGENLVAGENAKSALGAAHFYDNKLTGFVNKYLKKVGVQSEKRELSGKPPYPFQLRTEYAPVRSGSGPGPYESTDRWHLQGHGITRTYTNYFDALKDEAHLYGDLPTPKFIHASKADIYGPSASSTLTPELWIKWENFPKGAQRSTDQGVRSEHDLRTNYDGWGANVWGPYADEHDAAKNVEDILNSKKYLWQRGVPGEGTEVHSIPINDEVRAFVSQGQALFQRDPLFKSIKKSQGDVTLAERVRETYPNEAHPVRKTMDAIGRGSYQEPTVKGAVNLGGEAGSRLHLFKGADVSTVIHELGHVTQQYLPGLGGMDPEEFARSFEHYFATGKAPTPELEGPMREIASEMGRIYGHADNIPGAVDTPEIRAAFDKFFARESAADPHFAQTVGARWFAQQANEKHTLQDVSAPGEKTLWHNGPTTIGQANRMMSGEEGSPWHLHALDENGNLVGAMHGTHSDGHLHVVSAKVEPGHNGAFQTMTNALLDHGVANPEKVLSADLMNPKLEPLVKRIASRYDRPVHTDPETGRTYFQTNEGNVPPHDDNLANTYDPGLEYGMTKEEMDKSVQAFMREARTGRTAQDLSDMEERARRAARSEAAFHDPTEPDPRVRLANAEHESSGIMPIVEWNGHERMTPQVLTEMMNHIFESPTVGTYSKMRAARALSRIPTDRPPTESEFKLLEKIFGKQPGLRDLTKETSRWKQFMYELLNVPRSIMASFDLSAPLRQGLILSSQHPIIASGAFKDMMKMFASEHFYKTFMDGVETSPNAERYLKMDLAVTDMEHAAGTEAGEEAFASNMAEKIISFKPFMKNARTASPIRWSGRAYTGFLVKLRTDVADHLLKEAEAQGINIDTDTKFLKDLGNFINAATGRGVVLKKVEGSLDALNAAFFSPRLMASRMNFLNVFNPENYYRLDPFVRKQKIIAALTTTGVLTTVLGLASEIPGVTVGLDPRSADFAKIKIGDTRIDIAGGFQQYVRLFTEIGSMQTVSSTTGKTSSLWSSKFGGKTGLDVVTGFLEGKAAPLAGVLMDALRGSDAVGNPISISSEAKAHLFPLIAQDMIALSKDPPIHGMNPIMAAFAGYATETFGTGVQTYKAKDPAKKPQDKLQKQAKTAGFGTVPGSILLSLDHKAHLDSLSTQHPNDPQGRLKAAVKYYETTTHDKSFDSVLTQKLPDSVAETIYLRIRSVMIGAGLSQYEAAVKRALSAEGK